MKFLVDAQLPPNLASWLDEQGHAAQHVQDVGLRDADDELIWSHALAAGAIIVTKDEDFAEQEGITRPEVIQIYEDSDRELYVISAKWSIHRFDGDRFTTVRPNLPQHIIDASSGRWWIIQDKAGEWWVSTIEGLYRFPKVKRLEDLSHLNHAHVKESRKVEGERDHLGTPGNIG